MTDANLTELVCVLDRSGSMNSIIDDAIGGINRFIEDQQKEPGEARMTTVLFDTEFKTVHESVPIKDVVPFTKKTYSPRGMTALLDAVGGTIDSLGARLRGLPEEKRPGKVLFIILTDGHENSSHQYSHSRVKEMIEQQEKQWNWKFIYLSADMNAFAHGTGLGIGTRVSYSASGQSIGATYGLVSDMAARYRGADVNASAPVVLDSCVVSDSGEVEVVDDQTSDSTDG